MRESMIKEIGFNEKLKEVEEQFAKGTFLCVKAGNETNIMAIGWCMVGYMWNRPLFQILIRTSRYTYDLLEKGGDFTVNFPLDKDMQKEINYCGAKSGRKVDKAAECGFTLLPAQKVGSPIISDCPLHYECKVVAKQKLPVEQLSEGELNDEEDGHYHIMYYGEIIACYLTE
jgi:flavin reductase (DIM6/NTAB) family NADH-FMN oxidoreductase RutF